MTWNKALYPTNWSEIARREKDRAMWMCEECGADCLDPIDTRTVLTVHHIDHDPANVSPGNLIALCAPCHLRADAKWHARNAAITRAAKRSAGTIPMQMQIG